MAEKKQISIYLPNDLIKKIKLQALDEEISIGALVEKATNEYLQTK